MKLPQKLFVYIDGEGDDTVFIAVERLADIPEDHDGESVGTYDRDGVLTFLVKKELQ